MHEECPIEMNQLLDIMSLVSAELFGSREGIRVSTCILVLRAMPKKRERLSLNKLC